MTTEVKLGTIYNGKVVSIREFGAFVEIAPETDGLVHVSELSNQYVDRVEDVIKLGDMIKVKVINIDDTGRIKLSRKQAMADSGEVDPEIVPSGAGGGEEGGDRGQRRDDRGPRGGGGRGGDRGSRGGGGGRGGDRGPRR